MVGRRRKRPLEDAVGTVNSSEWVIANYAPSNAMPSPANTSTSEDSSRLQVHSAWTPSMDSIDQIDFATVIRGESSPAHTAEPYNFQDRKTSPPDSTGLPTPALSPPQHAYLSPMMLENKAPPSRTTSDNTSSCFLAPPMPSPACRTPQPQPADDEEMVCIKLLGHLKKSSAKEHLSRDEYLNLIKKSNASIRRILKSKKARSDYACVMLLSNIIIRVVELCDRVSKMHYEEAQTGESIFLSSFNDNFFNDSDQTCFIGDIQNEPPRIDRGATLQGTLMHVIELVSSVGSLLKRKPLNGFQTIGRHQALHLDLQKRLNASLALLS